MKLMRTLACAGVAALALTAALLPMRANAGSDTANLTVTATVTGTCTINAASLPFGSYTPATHLSHASTFSVTCTLAAPYGVAMGDGANYSSPYRRMLSGSYFLNYQLYTDAAETTVWNTTCPSTGGTSCINGTGTGAPASITVYGAIPATGNGTAAVGAGSYTDTVIMTINF